MKHRYVLKSLKGSELQCVGCKVPLRSITLSKPAPGDFVMCVNCGEVMVIEMTLRKAEESEIQEADKETREPLLKARRVFSTRQAKGV